LSGCEPSPVIVYYYFFYCLVCEAIGTAATPGLLCQPREIMKMIVEKQMECRLAGKPKFSEKTCPSATFVHHKILHDQTRDWTRAAAVGSRRLTAWAMAQPSVVVKAICYKPEGRGFKSRWGGFLNWPTPSGRTMALESTQPLTEMSTRNLEIKKRRANNLAAIY
jgi:hypothetical protein